MNITEKILARASKKSSVSPDDVIFADIDCAMVHDVSGPGVIKVFEKLEKQGIDTSKLWNPDKIWVAEDHFVPSAEKTSAANVAKLEKFVKKYNISKHFKYGLGQYGICHTLSHEEGLVSPGQVYVGGDSHTNTTGALGAFACGLGHTDMAYVMLNGKIWFKVPETVLFKLNGKLPEHVMAKDLILQIIGDIGTDGGAYGAMQFAGSGIDAMPVEERITLTNMTTEAGAKNGIIEADAKTEAYLAEHNAKPTKAVHGDSDAEYANTHEYEADKLEPLVAKPFSPQNIAPARDLSSVELNKAYIGSCTGAKMSDLEAAARILKGRKVTIRTEIVPAAISIMKKVMDGGLLKVFLDAGAVIGSPTCGACCGAHMGVLGAEEVCVSTTNRNFPGRMGHIESQTYLASPCCCSISSNWQNHRPEGSCMNGVVIKYKRDNIDTDAIIPGTYLKIHDYAELATHAMEGLDTDFHSKIKSGGDVIVAGKNFGCGSSREHAPIALAHSGIKAVLAVSFARIFYRNCVDGAFLLPVEISESDYMQISESDALEIDVKSNIVKNTTTQFL